MSSSPSARHAKLRSYESFIATSPKSHAVFRAPITRWYQRTSELVDHITGAAVPQEIQQEDRRNRDQARKWTCRACDVPFASDRDLQKHLHLFPSHVEMIEAKRHGSSRKDVLFSASSPDGLRLHMQLEDQHGSTKTRPAQHTRSRRATTDGDHTRPPLPPLLIDVSPDVPKLPDERLQQDRKFRPRIVKAQTMVTAAPPVPPSATRKGSQISTSRKDVKQLDGRNGAEQDVFGMYEPIAAQDSPTDRLRTGLANVSMGTNSAGKAPNTMSSSGASSSISPFHTAPSSPIHTVKDLPPRRDVDIRHAKPAEVPRGRPTATGQERVARLSRSPENGPSAGALSSLWYETSDRSKSPSLVSSVSSASSACPLSPLTPSDPFADDVVLRASLSDDAHSKATSAMGSREYLQMAAPVPTVIPQPPRRSTAPPTSSRRRAPSSPGVPLTSSAAVKGADWIPSSRPTPTAKTASYTRPGHVSATATHRPRATATPALVTDVKPQSSLPSPREHSSPVTPSWDGSMGSPVEEERPTTVEHAASRPPMRPRRDTNPFRRIDIGVNDATLVSVPTASAPSPVYPVTSDSQSVKQQLSHTTGYRSSHDQAPPAMPTSLTAPALMPPVSRRRMMSEDSQKYASLNPYHHHNYHHHLQQRPPLPPHFRQASCPVPSSPQPVETALGAWAEAYFKNLEEQKNAPSGEETAEEAKSPTLSSPESSSLSTKDTSKTTALLSGLSVRTSSDHSSVSRGYSAAEESDSSKKKRLSKVFTRKKSITR
ncbi:unnamed protein product [Sympodiomycopsis kandeliae]